MGIPLRRGQVAIQVLVAAVLVAACEPGMASWFGKAQPVPQWGLDAAKTPVPANAKDAPAVILFDEYVETVDAQGRAVEREREAIRILAPQGRGNVCGLSYDVDEKINYFRVWTIAADGKQYQAQDTDFAEVGDTDVPVMLSTEKRRIVHAPAVDVGAVEICESEELMAPYAQEKVWQIQNGVPVAFESLEVDLPAGGAHTQAWHNHAPVAPVEVAANHWRWEVKDMPALVLRDVPSHPDWSALAARMSVQWGDAAVAGTENQWRALGEDWTKLEANRPDASPEITAQAQQLAAGATDYYARLTRITDFIQKNIRYFVVLRGIGGWRANPASDVFRNRYGDCKDKTTLLISMLQVVGVRGFYVLVDDRRGVVDPAMPSFYGDHMITAIEIPADVQDTRLKAVAKGKDGKRYLIFDPTDERTPVGNLRAALQGGYGLLSAGTASELLALPVLPPEANGTERTGTFALAEDGMLTGTVDALHNGPDGAELRTFLKYTDEKQRHDYWETTIAHDLPGVTLSSFNVVQPAALDKPLEIHYALRAGQYARPAGNMLLVRLRVVGTDRKPFDDKPRTVPIDLSATGRWHDSFNLTLPPGYVVDETPDPVDIDMDFASYHARATAKGNQLHYEREYVVRQVEIPAERAGDFRKLEGSILQDEMGVAVLKKQ